MAAPRAGEELCPDCNKWFKIAGGRATKHMKRCLEEQATAQQALELRNEQNRLYRERESRARELRDAEGFSGPVPKNSLATYNEYPDNAMDYVFDEDSMDHQPSSPGVHESETPKEVPKSFLRITPHPRTGLCPREINLERPPPPSLSSAKVRKEPWAPFASLSDYLWARSRTERLESDKHIDEDLKRMRDGTYASDCKISFMSATHMRAVVDEAGSIYQQFRPIEFEVPLKMKGSGEVKQIKYTVWVKDGMEWLREAIRDPALASFFKWHAEKKEIVINGEAERYVDEPLSGDDAWEQEDHLDKDQVQVLLMMYSDKSNAARFAKTCSMWPVLARIGNLPSHISNQNNGFAGNTLLGFLPNISIPAGQEGNTHWANHHREAFHRAWDYILEPFKEAALSGFAMHCGDGAYRRIVIRFPIISNDLEEAYLASLTRGNNAIYPCPRCLVHKDAMHDLTPDAPPTLRRQLDSQKVVETAILLRARGLGRQAEEHLKNTGLCEVKNAWWNISRADVHEALSFDVLHSIFLGVWGSHCWPLVLASLNDVQLAELDDRAKQVPGFPGIKIFSEIGQKAFADGNSHFSIMQQLLPLIHDFIGPQHQPFLQLIRLLVDITFHARFKMQTMSRIEDGKRLIVDFSKTLKFIKNTFTDSTFTEKNWDFPKLHQLSHLFSDIINKGCVSFLSCNIGESFHKGLIATYQGSNKKEVVAQILRGVNRMATMNRIQWRIDQENQRAEEERKQQREDRQIQNDSGGDEREAEGAEESSLDDVPIVLKSPGSKRKVNAQKIEDEGGFFPERMDQPAFRQFGILLSQFIHKRQLDLMAGTGAPVELARPFDIKIMPYRRMDIQYYSLDDGLENRDIIQCRPSYFGRPRFDTVLVQTIEGRRPARLQLVFETNMYDKVWQIAFVTYFTRLPSLRIDGVIGMGRYEEEKEGEFIFLGAVIRACYLSPIYSSPGLFYLNDLAAGCTDLYIRCSQIE